VLRLGNNHRRKNGGTMGTNRMTVHFAFDNSYASLPARFHARLDPTPVAAPTFDKGERRAR